MPEEKEEDGMLQSLLGMFQKDNEKEEKSSVLIKPTSLAPKQYEADELEGGNTGILNALGLGSILGGETEISRHEVFKRLTQANFSHRYALNVRIVDSQFNKMKPGEMKEQKKSGIWGTLKTILGVAAIGGIGYGIFRMIGMDRLKDAAGWISGKFTDLVGYLRSENFVEDMKGMFAFIRDATLSVWESIKTAGSWSMRLFRGKNEAGEETNRLNMIKDLGKTIFDAVSRGVSSGLTWGKMLLSGMYRGLVEFLDPDSVEEGTWGHTVRVKIQKIAEYFGEFYEGLTKDGGFLNRITKYVFGDSELESKGLLQRIYEWALGGEGSEGWVVTFGRRVVEVMKEAGPLIASSITSVVGSSFDWWRENGRDMLNDLYVIVKGMKATIVWIAETTGTAIEIAGTAIEIAGMFTGGDAEEEERTRQERDEAARLSTARRSQEESDKTEEVSIIAKGMTREEIESQMDELNIKLKAEQEANKKYSEMVTSSRRSHTLGYSKKPLAAHMLGDSWRYFLRSQKRIDEIQHHSSEIDQLGVRVAALKQSGTRIREIEERLRILDEHRDTAPLTREEDKPTVSIWDRINQAKDSIGKFSSDGMEVVGKVLKEAAEEQRVWEDAFFDSFGDGVAILSKSIEENKEATEENTQATEKSNELTLKDIYEKTQSQLASSLSSFLGIGGGTSDGLVEAFKSESKSNLKNADAMAATAGGTSSSRIRTGEADYYSLFPSMQAATLNQTISRQVHQVHRIRK